MSTLQSTQRVQFDILANYSQHIPSLEIRIDLPLRNGAARPSQPFGALVRLPKGRTIADAGTASAGFRGETAYEAHDKTAQHCCGKIPDIVACCCAAQLRGARRQRGRFVGTVTAINGTTLTVKTDAGEARQVAVPVGASIKRIAPGQKDLSTAETIQFSDLAAGDRVLVRLDPDAPGPPPQALQIVAIKQSDVAAKQQKDREDWQRRGVGGLVKSVDAAAGVIVLTSGAGATAKTVTVHTTKATVLKRYAPASVRFDDAQPAPIDAIHPGDQLRARGQKNADGTEIDADEVVSGSFRNISGIITSHRHGELDLIGERSGDEEAGDDPDSRRMRRCGGCRSAWRRLWRRG